MGRLRVVLCSRNEHKRRELEDALPGWAVELLEQEAYPEEGGASFYANARAKALYGRSVGPAEALMLGEDSGLEVEALGGGPGVETARWAGGRHVGRLLEALEGVDDRRARYVCELVAIGVDEGEARGRGTLEGTIGLEARGVAGFGFDPVFVPAGETRTVGELGEAWKAERSHRARAARALLAALGVSS